MSETQLRVYCLEQARSILGAATIADLICAANEIFAFLTDTAEAEPTRH